MDGGALTTAREREGSSGGGWDGGDRGDGGSGGDRGGSGSGAVPAGVSMAGIWVAIIAIVMFFAALTSTWLILKNTSRAWTPTALPAIIYLNSLFLLASSLSLEFSRSYLAAGLRKRFLACLYVTLGLGVAFIAGQLDAWRDLVRQGIYLATNPSSSFFYVLTAAHGLHLVGGIIALLITIIHGPKIARGLASRTLLDVTAIYWHFMYGLWIYILLLLVLKV
ncbi:MAG: cytochrome c oxidase subunit 3 [Terriglobia bacterium]